MPIGMSSYFTLGSPSFLFISTHHSGLFSSILNAFCTYLQVINHLSVVKRFALFLASIQSHKTSKFTKKYSSYIIFRETTKTKNTLFGTFFSRKSSDSFFTYLQVFKLYMYMLVVKRFARL